MARVYSISFLVGSGALAFTLMMIHIVVPAMGDAPLPSMYVTAFICCYAIGCPIAYFLSLQNRRLVLVLSQLEAAHLELAAAHERICEKARRDPLTGVLNREYFFEATAQLRKRPEAGTLLIVDADHFKQVNDRWGHLKGDEALRLIADAISTSVRSGDITGRIGGEEFCVFLPETSGDEAVAVADRIRRAVQGIEFQPDGEGAWPLSVSIGGAGANTSSSMAQLMRTADARLYEAKRKGRNCTVMSAELLAAA